jgi:tripartite-type tricarboxylate transporter receptor subunit TctC
MKTPTIRHHFTNLACVAAITTATFSGALLAQDGSGYPKRDIEFVVGYNAGGGYSSWAQALAPALEEQLGNKVNVLVRHMPGAGSVVATNYVYRAKPDGYTIGIFNLGGLAATQTASEVMYDLSEMTWLGRLSLDPTIMVVGADSKMTKPSDFQGRDKTVVSTKGLTANATITGAVTFDRLDVDWQALNHTGTSEAILSIIRGDSDVAWGSYDSLKQYLENGDLKMLMYYDASRNPEYPDVPTPSEIGLPAEINEAFNTNRILGGPPGMPEDVANTLEKAIAAAVKDPEFQKRLEKMEVSVQYLNGEQTAKVVNNAVKGFTDYKDTISKLLNEK